MDFYSEKFKEKVVSKIEKIGIQKTSLELDIPEDILLDWYRVKQIKDCCGYTRKDNGSTEELSDEMVQQMIAPLIWYGKLDEDSENEYPYWIGMDEDMFGYLANGYNWSIFCTAFIDNVMPELADELLNDCEISAFIVNSKSRDTLIKFAVKFKDMCVNAMLFHHLFAKIDHRFNEAIFGKE